jgi:hypothetical protein
MESETTHPLAHKAADDPDRTHPASAGLKPLNTVQHSSLVLAGDELISRRRKNGDPEVRELERGLARRKIELYERMLADDAAGKRTGPPASELRELLAGARDDAYVREHGGDDLDTGHLRDPEGDEAAHG